MKVLYTRNEPSTGFRATVNQFDPDDPELCVKLWRHGVYCSGAEYYTDCIDDAIGTIDATIQRLKEREEKQ